MTDFLYGRSDEVGPFFGLPVIVSKYLPEESLLIMPERPTFLPEFDKDEWRIPWESDSLSYQLRRNLALQLYAMERRLGLEHDPGMEDRLFPRASLRSRLHIMQEAGLALLVQRPDLRGIAVISSVGPA